MVTRVKFTQDAIIAYGPQRVLLNQVMDVEDDAAANALIAQGLAVLDATDADTTAPLIDGGNAMPGDPGGQVEQEDQTG